MNSPDPSLAAELASLTTEQPNPDSAQLSSLSTEAILRVMNDADRTVPEAVAEQLPQIGAAVDCAVARLAKGGRLFYVGAGTSGRLGIVDASECPPTFGTDPELVQGIIAGGPEAVFRSQEGAEDCPEAAAAELERRGLTDRDVVVALSASGRTPFCLGALQYAREVEAARIALVCNAGSPLAAAAEIAIAPIVGPEVVTGSTRLKAGTAEKLVLNMLSTATMVRLGRVEGNRMVDMQLRSGKLQARALRLTMELTGAPAAAAQVALDQAGGSVRQAVAALNSAS